MKRDRVAHRIAAVALSAFVLLLVVEAVRTVEGANRANAPVRVAIEFLQAEAAHNYGVAWDLSASSLRGDKTRAQAIDRHHVGDAPLPDPLPTGELFHLASLTEGAQTARVVVQVNDSGAIVSRTVDLLTDRGQWLVTAVEAPVSRPSLGAGS